MPKQGKIVDKAARAVAETYGAKADYYRELKRRNVIRLILTYLVPIIVLSVYFYFHQKQIMSQSQRSHLEAIAENQAKTLDLFLTERLVNLSNLISDPRLEIPPTSKAMAAYLDKLKSNSATFVDLGFFDSTGIQSAYAGPFPSLENRNYSSESWYATLKANPDSFVITDIYLGFRQKPHFTIGVSRIINGQFAVLRATLEPQKMYEYITTLEGSHEVNTSIVNADGFYQLVTPGIGAPLQIASIVPPLTPRLGSDRAQVEGRSVTYAYSWLRGANWALVVQPAGQTKGTILSSFEFKSFGITAAIVLIVFLIILNRANRLVEMVVESDRARSQLEHAAKLASVGELAAGIAHEINNPLAAISEEAGLMKDLISREFGASITPEEMSSHLDSIHESVFRCRDVTQKLLKFVRKTDLDLKPHDVHRLIDDVVDGLLGHEMAVSNIVISRNYDPNLPLANVDGNQLEQVFLNILNNAVDAIGGRPGRITITTSHRIEGMSIAIADNGKGIPPEHLDKIFLPFFTTKEVGKGTGLGLSVSYGIIKSLGGSIDVESTVGRGTTFTIILPLPQVEAAQRQKVEQ
jgi:two-component system NtrC family sensor kinase